MEKYYGKTQDEMSDDEINLHNLDVFLFACLLIHHANVTGHKMENPVTGRITEVGTQTQLRRDMGLRYGLVAKILGYDADDINGKQKETTSFLKMVEETPYSLKKFNDDFLEHNGDEMFKEVFGKGKTNKQKFKIEFDFTK